MLKKKNHKILKKVGLITGKFNIIHPGHVRVLNFAKEICDELIVGVCDDDHEGVTIKQTHRIESLKNFKIIDKVIPFSKNPLKLIKKIKPNIVIKGKEFSDKKNIEEEICKSIGAEILFASGELTFSSNYFISKYSSNISQNINKNLDFLKRYGSSKSILKKKIINSKKVNVCVFGDTIIDHYVYCDPINLSQEEPIVVVKKINEKKFIGGAAIVSCHAAGLNAFSHFISVTGNDENSNFLKDGLKLNKVRNYILKDNTRPTILKTRYKASNRSLLKVTELREHDISKKISRKIINIINKKIKKIDVFIFSDFNYGIITNELIHEIVNICKKNKINVVADCQSSSQYGDISKYKNVDFVSPTEREIRLALSDNNSSLSVLANHFREKTSVKNIVITLGQQGILINGRYKGNYHTDRLPSFNSSPVDTSGAGDSFICSTSIFFRQGFSIWESVFLGSIAASIKVSKNGNVPISLNEILNLLN